MPNHRGAAAAASAGGGVGFVGFVVPLFSFAAFFLLTETEAFAVVVQPRSPVHRITMAGTGSGSGSKPPLSNLKQLKYDYSAVINQVRLRTLNRAHGTHPHITRSVHPFIHPRSIQAAKAATDAIKDGKLRLITIDYPPAEGPTNTKRFETDRDFVIKLLAGMRYKTVVPIGDEIIIGESARVCTSQLGVGSNCEHLTSSLSLQTQART